MTTTTGKIKTILELDQLVADYLAYRKCNDAEALISNLKDLGTNDSYGRGAITSRILSAFDDGDYQSLLSLWETHIVQSTSDTISLSLGYEVKAAEFLCNLHCAVYPFRPEVIRRVDAPEIAAKAAARSMTIFKHFYESRGGGVATQGSEFHNYRGLHKIAFPPTHPQCRDLFLQGWVHTTRLRIENFLSKFLESVGPESNLKSMPTLYQLYATNRINSDNINSNNGEAFHDIVIQPDTSVQTSEVMAMFQNREEKLIRFSQSIIDLTSDLLGLIENGDALDQSLLSNFKEKFNFFRNALPVLPSQNENNNKNSPKNAPLTNLVVENNDNYSSVAHTSGTFQTRNKIHPDSHTKSTLPKKSPSQSVSKMKRRRRSLKEVDIHTLKFEEIVSDLFSKVHEVENFLIESLEPEPRVPVSGTIDPILEPKLETKMKYAISSAMTGSSLACTLAHMIVRPDKDDQPIMSRESAVNVLVQYDILGVVKRSRRRASIERMEPDTTDWALLMKTSMRNEGVVGFIDSVRCYIQKQSTNKNMTASSSCITAAVGQMGTMGMGGGMGGIGGNTIGNQGSTMGGSSVGMGSSIAGGSTVGVAGSTATVEGRTRSRTSSSASLPILVPLPSSTPRYDGNGNQINSVNGNQGNSVFDKNDIKDLSDVNPSLVPGQNGQNNGQNIGQNVENNGNNGNNNGNNNNNGELNTLGLLEASQCLCESLYRLVVAIGSTSAGREYLHTYGSELTSHTTKLLILLPSNFSYQDVKNSTGVFSDGVFEGSSLTVGESVRESVTGMTGSSSEKRVSPILYNHNNASSSVSADMHHYQDGHPAFSLRLWCILALTVLAAQNEGSKDTQANEQVMRAVQRVVGAVPEDNLQLLIVKDGALEWLNEAFFSLLMEILAAAFSGNPRVLLAAVGNDSLAIGMAALSLDARQPSSRMRLSSDPNLISHINSNSNNNLNNINNSNNSNTNSNTNLNSLNNNNNNSNNGNGNGNGSGSNRKMRRPTSDIDLSYQDSNNSNINQITPSQGPSQGPSLGPSQEGHFSISLTASDTVPQELLVLLDLCLGMLLFAARSHQVQATLTSTIVFQDLTRQLLKTLFRLVLLPQLTQALADSLIVILNVLFRDDIKIRELARDLKELNAIERKISIGGLRWFLDPSPLRNLLFLISSDGVRNLDKMSSSRTSFFSGTSSGTNTGGGGILNLNGIKGLGSDSVNPNGSQIIDNTEIGTDFVVTSLADVALSKVMVTQTYATDNVQLLDYLSKQKSFTGKVNTSILMQYEDQSKINYHSPTASGKGSHDDNSKNQNRYTADSLPHESIPFTPRK